MESKRTVDQVNQEYSNLCTQLGDMQVKFEANKSMLMGQIMKLANEIAQIQAAEQDANNVPQVVETDSQEVK